MSVAEQRYSLLHLKI